MLHVCIDMHMHIYGVTVYYVCLYALYVICNFVLKNDLFVKLY